MHKGEKFQTKGLHPLGGMFSQYEITPSGRLEFLEYRIDDRSNPTAEGLDRLASSITTVFTGGRRDMNYHGWLDLSGLGRANFTDGTIVALEPELEQPSHHCGSTGLPGLPPREWASEEWGTMRTKVSTEATLEDQERSAVTGTAHREAVDHNLYLRKFFAELERLRPVPDWGRPHALTCSKGGFHVLLALGDARVSLPFEKMDADPIRMAQAVIAKWQATPESELHSVE